MYTASLHSSREPVTSGRQGWGAFGISREMILDSIDQGLGVLNTHSHGKGLLLEGNPVPEQKGIDISR